jgi:NAD(P)-dependent dehydrogenase (short-subunit alcohol dehydrogenase family)
MGVTEDRSRYDGLRSVVVGCATGMGAATAAIVRLLGGEVHGVDHVQPEAELDGFTLCDLRRADAVDDLVAGLGRVDRLFYCAGLPQTHPPLDVMRVNFCAMRAVVEGVVPTMPAGGAVAIVSSNAGLRYQEHMEAIDGLLATDGYRGAEAWCAAAPDVVADGYTLSKEAIIVFTMRYALEAVHHGVRVNCISPGPTATPMMPEFERAVSPEMIRAFEGPMERQAQPEEMGWPLAFLNSAGASFVTGCNLIVDGGFVAGVATGRIDVAALFAQGQAAMEARRS